MRSRLQYLLLIVNFVVAAQPVAPPAVKTRVEPRYPDDLKFYFTDHPEVQLTIDDKGGPFAIQSNLEIPDNVVKAIRQWRFEPARQGKSAVGVAISMIVPIRRPLSEAVGLGRTSASTVEIAEADKIAKDLDEAGEAAIEQKIEKNPADAQSHLVAIRYLSLHDSPAHATARLHLLRWFAEITPQSELLGMPGASPRREQAGTDDYEALRKLWKQKLSDGTADQKILDNATNFLRISDPVEAEGALLKWAKSTDHAVNLLGELYAFAGMGVTAVEAFRNVPTNRSEDLAATSYALDAREKLLKTDNVRLLFSGLHAVDGAGDMAFCNALLGRAKEFYAGAAANCAGVASKPSGNTARMGGNVIAANLLKPVRPDFPQEAKARGVYGTVKFEAKIGTDGKIHDLELLSGPFLLYDSAREAVTKWEYRPTRLNGEPIEVITTIDVNYNRSQ